MTTASHLIVQVLEHLVKVLPVGTNRALLHLMWAIISGAFLSSRGAVHSGLQEAGFPAADVRRGWQALRYGVWHSDELLARWRHWVTQQTAWQPNQYEGWQALAIDLTAFWRPRLQHWPGRYFHHVGQRRLPGVAFAVVAQVGQVASQRVPLLRQLLRADKQAETEEGLKQQLLVWVRTHLGPAEAAICDAGITLEQMLGAGVPRFVLRLARNCSLRRNVLPPRQGRGRPSQYGAPVRPLARTFRGRFLEATPPDVQGTFTEPILGQGAAVTVAFHGWYHLVPARQKAGPDQVTVSVWLFFDPRFRDPLVLATNLPASAAAVYSLYRDRWPVEQVPLAAKQMLGLQRQFVFAPTSVWRLPELALLLGNVLTVVAALLSPIPTGYWDRHPKKRLAASDASCAKPIFPFHTPWRGEFEKKRPVLTTCLRESRPIAVSRELFSCVDHLFPALSGLSW